MEEFVYFIELKEKITMKPHLLMFYLLRIAFTLVLLSPIGVCSVRHANADGSFISAPNRVDMVHDPIRNILYITSGGQVLQYDLKAQQFLTPFQLGGNLKGIDLSPDANTLAVADEGQIGIFLITLNTGDKQRVSFTPGQFGEEGTFSVAYGNDGNILITSSFNGSGWVPLRQYNPSTGAVTIISSLMDITQDTMLSASADGSIIGFAESNISDGRWGRYRVSDGDYVERTGYADGTSAFNYEIATNRNGTQFAIPTYYGTYIYDSNYNKISTIGTYAGTQPIGCVYHPNKDILYCAMSGTNELLAYETSWFAQVGSYNVEYTFQNPGNFAYQQGRLKISRDGSLLFVTVGGGVQYVANNPISYQLTANTTGTGSGILTSTTSLLQCSGNTCSGMLDALTSATITATPDANSFFAGWTGCQNATNNPCLITMTAASTVTATINACNITITPPSNTSFEYPGGGANIMITAADSSCAWTATSSNPSWLSLTSASNGSGNGSVTFTVLNNPRSIKRTGTITIAGQQVTIVQAASKQSKIGVFRNGAWYMDYLATTSWSGCDSDGCYNFGMASDIPVIGNWDGTGPLRMGVFRQGKWYLDIKGNGIWDPSVDTSATFGMVGDIPVVGDWNGSGNTKIGVFRNGMWYLDYNGSNAWESCGAPANTAKDACISFGMVGDIPVVGDWNGSGVAKIGVFRNGMWYLDYPGTGTWVGCGAPADVTKDACIPFGMAGDIPVVGDWNGDGRIKIGVFRDGTWYLDYNGNNTWDGCGAPGDLTKDACFTYGFPTDIPIAGQW